MRKSIRKSYPTKPKVVAGGGPAFQGLPAKIEGWVYVHQKTQDQYVVISFADGTAATIQIRTPR